MIVMLFLKNREDEAFKKMYTEEQIIRILREGAKFENIREVCRLAVAEHTFYRGCKIRGMTMHNAQADFLTIADTREQR